MQFIAGMVEFIILYAAPVWRKALPNARIQRMMNSAYYSMRSEILGGLEFVIARMTSLNLLANGAVESTRNAGESA